MTHPPRLVACLALAWLALLAPEVSHAATLASWTNDHRLQGSGSTPLEPVLMDLRITPRGGDPFAAPTAILFQDFVLSPSDVGLVLTATAATDPGFNDFAGALTNGSDDYLANRFLCSGCIEVAVGGWSPEVPGTGGDLAGFAISKITLEINAFEIIQCDGSATDPQDPCLGEPPGRFVAPFAATISIIPEPTTALLLACGLVGLGVRRRLQ